MATADEVLDELVVAGNGRSTERLEIALAPLISASATTISPPSSAQPRTTTRERRDRAAAARSRRRPRSPSAAARSRAEVLADRCARGVDQRLGVEARRVLGDPRSTTGASAASKVAISSGGEHDVLVAGVDRDLDAAVVGGAPDLGRPCAASPRPDAVSKTCLDVVGQRFPARLVHRHLEGRGAEARLVRTLDLVLGHVLQLQRRDDLPGDQRAVDRARSPAPAAGRAPAWSPASRRAPRRRRCRSAPARAASCPAVSATVRTGVLGHLDRLAGVHVVEEDVHASYSGARYSSNIARASRGSSR